MAETILVTGATGTVGSEVVRQLSAKVEIIKAAVRSPNDTAFKQLNGVQAVQLDFNNTETFDSAFHGVDKIFLLTPTDPKLLDFTSNLVNAATKKSTEGGQIKHIVKLSHIRADVEPKIEISQLHSESEKIIEEAGIPFAFLRPNFFMQNFLIYGQKTSDNISFYLPAGDGKVSFVDIRDIAAVTATVLTDNGNKHIGKSYDITGPESLTYAHAIEILSRESNKKMDYTNISEEAARIAMKKLGMADWHINYVMELFSITRAGYLSSISTAVEDVTGRTPTSILQFGRDYVNSFK